MLIRIWHRLAAAASVRAAWRAEAHNRRFARSSGSPGSAFLADTLLTLHEHWRGLLVFHLVFSALATTLLVPLASWTLGSVGAVTGRPTVATVGLADLVLSPGGWLWIFVAIMATAYTAVLQQAGMVMTGVAADRLGPYRSALAGVWHVARKPGPLLALAGILVAVLLAVTLPFAGITALGHQYLLGGYDSYYVRLARPPEFWVFVGTAVISAAGWLACVGWLYLRWLLALPLIILDGRSALAALRESALRMPGSRRAATGVILALGALGLLLPPLAAVGIDFSGGWLLALVPERPRLVVPVMLAYMTLVVALAIVITFAGTALHATLLLGLYRRAGGAVRTTPIRGQRHTGQVLWSAEALLLVFALGQVYLLLPEFDERYQVRNTAHRGSSIRAPENSLPAIERAVADGADAVEIDVRQTADGVLVLWHDRDLRRLGGDNRRVAEVSYDTLQMIDVGAHHAPHFAGTRAPTLAEAIDVLRGQTDIYVDIKMSPRTPDITRNVIALLRAEGVVDQSAILSVRPSVLKEVDRREPGLMTIQLAEFVVGRLDRGAFDGLALRQNRVNAVEVARARRHGYELHVWTVNNPAAMERFISLGVDNIITDRPDALARRLAERADMTPGERLLLALRNWHQR